MNAFEVLIQREKATDDGSRNAAAHLHGARAVENSTGDGANLLREALFRHSDVDADAEHGPVETAVFKINGSFR